MMHAGGSICTFATTALLRRHDTHFDIVDVTTISGFRLLDYSTAKATQRRRLLAFPPAADTTTLLTLYFIFR